MRIRTRHGTLHPRCHRLSFLTAKHCTTKGLILYKGDAWLSTASLRLVAAFTQAASLGKFLKELAQAENLSEKELERLVRCKQTQGRTINYMIEYQEFDPEYEQLRHEIS